MVPAGCTLLSTSELPFARKKPEYETPRQVVPVWSDTVLHQSGTAATRGFGGRLMFYGQDKQKSIRVDGSMIVYAWDDSKGSMERAPDRKYVFPAESLQTHYSASSLGHSYSFWVPWDAAGGPLQHVTLISRFLSNDGTELTGTPAHVVLQGPSDSSPFPNELNAARTSSKDSDDGDRLSTRLRSRSTGGIQQVGYETEENHVQEVNHHSYSRGAHPGLQTSEIGLTRGFYERNMQGSQIDRTSAESTVLDANELLTPTATNSPRSIDAFKHNDASPSSHPEPADGVELAEELDQRSTRFPPFESRVRKSRAIRSFDGHARKEPPRARSLNGLPETSRSSESETE
jgi:hypothetical protein